MNLSDMYGHLKRKLTSDSIESPDLEARFILKHHLGVEWGDIIADPHRNIPESMVILIENDLKRRLNGESLSRIHGIREFHGLEFRLGKATLDPRPETELIVDRALELFHGKQSPARILDLGTGTGCIIISLLSEWPESRGVAVDLSAEALDVAGMNAEIHKVAHRLEFKQGSWGQGVSGSFDLVVSNPPYIPTADIANLESVVRNHDPILALDGGFDGLEAYKKIFFDLKRLLTPCGKALFEIGAGQEADIVRLGGESRIRIECVHPDLAGIPRVVEISSGDK
jgi:release factor glutamine methyltransferase